MKYGLRLAVILWFLSVPSKCLASYDLAIGQTPPLDRKQTARLAVADIINRHPDRFLFGSDEVGPTDEEKYLKVYNLYAPLWKLLDKSAADKVLKLNYERIFNEGRRKVRAWEQANVPGARTR